MPHASLVNWFCRFYVLLLYAYPRPFRLRYGGEMQQVFRDRCRYLARTQGRLKLLRFAIHSAADWFTTSAREQLAALAILARGIWITGRRASPRGFVTEWVITILTFLFATTTLVQAYVVPTGSMESNLRVGDHVLVDRVAYSDPGATGRHLLPYREVQRGDIAVFLFPEDIRQTYVKRVIGLPGDHVRIVNKQVIRNGHRLIEPYTQHIDLSRQPYRDDFPAAPVYSTTLRGRDMLAHHVVDGELVVPPNTLFCLGDNRENSADSRYWGLVPRENVVGTPLLVYWSFDAPTSDLEEWNVDHVIDVALHFFTKTRWQRMLTIPRSQTAQEEPFTP
jgi:signal peptidase I